MKLSYSDLDIRKSELLEYIINKGYFKYFSDELKNINDAKKFAKKKEKEVKNKIKLIAKIFHKKTGFLEYKEEFPAIVINEILRELNETCF